jgi:hypothetical protein
LDVKGHMDAEVRNDSIGSTDEVKCSDVSPHSRSQR